MKRMALFGVFLVAVLVASCTRSQFSTTTRHSRNGKVSYVNHHPMERSRSLRAKACKIHPSRNVPRESLVVSGETGTPIVANPDLLTARSSGNPERISLLASNSTGPTGPAAYDDPWTLAARAVPGMDAGKTMMLPEHRVMIPAKTATTGIAVGSASPAAGKRKIEVKALLGFIFSILGWFPVAGIPFAILGVIFSAVSLRSFNTTRIHLKGRWMAIAGLVIGILGIIFNVIFTAYLVATMEFPMNFSFGGW